MKTAYLSLIALCGALAVPPSFAGQSADTQNASPQPKESVPGKSASADRKSDRVNSNHGPKGNGLSAGLDDIVELAEAGVDESVILSFIQTSPVEYHPSAQEVIKLRERGISTPVITTLLHRGVELRQNAAEAQKGAQATAATATNPQASAPAPSTAVQPATVYYAPATPSVVYAPSPTYTYATYGYGGYYYPRYYYGWYPRFSYWGGCYPRVSFGVRFGGIHGGGFHGGYRHWR